jgi:hypothetical protein
MHVFAQIEMCDKWTETWTALTKANVVFGPRVTPTHASEDWSIGNKKANALRDAVPVIEMLHSPIMACMEDAGMHAAKRAEQAA